MTGYVLLARSPRAPDGHRSWWQDAAGGPAYCLVSYHDTAARAADAADAADEVWIGRSCGARQWSPPPPEAGALLAVGQEPRPGYEDEFTRWMDGEHVPALGGVTGTLSAQRYEAVTGSPRFYALYYLTGTDVPVSAEWRAASDTPWRARMRDHTQGRVRTMYLPACSS